MSTLKFTQNWIFHFESGNVIYQTVGLNDPVKICVGKTD